MAIDKHASEIVTSIHGRRLGLDSEGHVAGPSGLRAPVETSTAASTLTAYGVSVLTGSTASHTLPAPSADGVMKTVINASTVSTATMTITRATSDYAILGSTGGDPEGAAFNLLNSGSAMTFVGYYHSAEAKYYWAPTISKPSSLYYTISTSS